MALQDHDDVADGVAPGGRAGFASIPDGEYDFEVDAVELKETKSGTDIFKMKLTCLSDPAAGREFEHDYFLTSKDKDTGKITLNDVKVGILKKDLQNCGFDTDHWTKAAGRPLSKELPRAILVMHGLRVKGKKSTNGNYSNFVIVGRDHVADAKPEKFGPAELDAAVAANANPFTVD